MFITTPKFSISTTPVVFKISEAKVGTYAITCQRNVFSIDFDSKYYFHLSTHPRIVKKNYISYAMFINS